MDYEKQAIDFLNATGTTFKATFKENGFHFEGDKDVRDIYTIELKRGSRKYTFDFGQSINNSGFYASYGRQKYDLPREKMNLKDHQLRIYVEQNINDDFGNVSNDKIFYPIAPTAYDVLTCLQKYDVGTFEDFCGEFGYDEDSRKALKTYKAVCKEYDKVCGLWNDEEIEKLQEIQ